MNSILKSKKLKILGVIVFFIVIVIVSGNVTSGYEIKNINQKMELGEIYRFLRI